PLNNISHIGVQNDRRTPTSIIHVQTSKSVARKMTTADFSGNALPGGSVVVRCDNDCVQIMGSRWPSRDNRERECRLSFDEMAQLADRLEMTATAELFHGHDKVASDLRQGASVIRFLLSKL